MSEVVASYAVGAFVEPQNGESPIDADAVRLNDNTVRVGFNNHDADPGIHFQGSTLAARPAAGTSGRKWMASDTKQIFRDNGSSWDEIDYLNKTNGGTVTGAATFSGGLTSTSGSRTFGATTFSGAISGTSASFTSTISSAGATFTGAVSGTSASFSSTLGVTGLATFSGGISVTGTSTLAAVTATTVTTTASGSAFGTDASTGEVNARFGTVSVQSFSLNNGWIADNLYFDGANFKYRETGYASQIYFVNGGIAIYTAPSNTAGTSVTPTIRGTFTNSGILAWGTAVTTSASAGDVVLKNSASFSGVNAAGTGVLGMLFLDGANRTVINANHAALRIANESTAGTAGAVSEYLIVQTDAGARKIALLAT